jgi:hypothetical protein
VSDQDIRELDKAISRQLAHLKKYGELVDLQQELIERSDYKGLLDILNRKEKVLSRMGDPKLLPELVARQTETDPAKRERTSKLFDELVSRLDFFAAREAESMDQASGLKAELAGGIFALRRGKRMLRKYSQNSGTGKARFKDLTG